MNKYAAVIIDSFREAFASRVLWLVLLLITLLLVIIAPLGYREDLTWRLRDNDVKEWPDLMVMVREQAENEEPSPARRVYSLLGEELQKDLIDLKIPGKDSDAANPFEFIKVFGNFQKTVNKILERRDFYDDDSFNDVQFLSNELRDLRNEGIDSLEDNEVARFNRLLMEASFPDLVRGSPPTSIQLTYAVWDFGQAYPLRGATLRQSLQSSAALVMKWFVGAIGVFIAVLVTAPIIPQMFDTGALHLLLSKPISRWLLFLSKYVGGCTFILIGATYLIGGLWFIMGVRFGIWDSKLLLSIPIYLFVFAIYYAVASLVGVIWRSPIVSVALTIIFWLACFVIGTTKIGFETAIWNKSRLVRIVEAGDSLIVSNEMGVAHEWDEKQSKWEEVFVTQDQKQSRAFMLFMPTIPREFRPIGPVYDKKNDRLMSAQPTFPPTKLNFYVAPRSEDWEPDTNITAPTGTIALFQEDDGQTLAVSSMGLYQLAIDPTAKQKPVKLFDWEIPIRIGSPFRSVSPDPPILLTQPSDAARNKTNGELALYTRSTVTLVKPGNRYEIIAERKLEGAERQPAVVGIGGSTILVGRDDGRLQVFDATTLEPRSEFRVEGPNQTRFVSASPDGRSFAVVFHNRRLWIYDAENNEITKARVKGQGDISCAQFLADGKLAVVDRTVRLSTYEVPTMKVDRRYSPKLGLLASAYRYALVPLYTIFPKPGELDKTFQYILSGKETEGDDSEDLASAQQNLDPWTPLWSSALFTVVILAIACVYIEWQEF